MFQTLTLDLESYGESSEPFVEDLVEEVIRQCDVRLFTFLNPNNY